MLADLGYVLRRLLKSPGFVTVVTLTLALGIGANTAIFSLFDQVILRTLPVESPRELVLFDGSDNPPGSSSSDSGYAVLSLPMYLDLKERATSFTGLLARAKASVSLAHGAESELAKGELVSGNFFEVLGVRAFRGRLFRGEEEKDDAAGAHPFVVLSHGYWLRRFGGREDLLGEKLTINAHPMVVIGVAPAAFQGVLSGAKTPDLYLPLAMWRQAHPAIYEKAQKSPRFVHWLNLMGRLKSGVPLEQAQAEIQQVYRAILEEELKLSPRRIGSPDFLSRRLTLLPALQGIPALKDRIEAPLTSMMALVGMVLLIACVNVTGLSLARAIARSREVAIRLALGARGGALVRQLLLESLVLAFAGGLVGLLIAHWTTELLIASAPLGGAEMSAQLDMRILVFNFLVAAGTGILFGLAPAIQSVNTKVVQTLKDQSAGSGEGRRHALFRKAPVVAQVALSTVLLVVAGLFARSLHNLRSLDPGFHTENLLTFGIDPKLNGYTQERGFALYHEVLERMRKLPGVQNAAAAAVAVLTNSAMGGNITVEGYQAEEGEYTGASRNLISPQFFPTMGIPLLLGRGFDDRDATGAPKVAVVNQEFARRYFGGENPIGRRLRFGSGNAKPDIAIVGVARNQKHTNLREDAKAFVYIPYTQAEAPQADELPSLNFYIRTNGDSTALATDVRRLVAELDAGLPLYEMKTMTVVVDESVTLERAVAMLSGSFAGLATLLAAVGLYGLMAYSVTRRTREIGIRLALGAMRLDLFRLVMKEALLYLGIGLSLGIPVAFAGSRYLESQLFGLDPNDGVAIAAAAVVLGLVAVGAALLPVRRAMRLNPIEALREE